MVVLSTMMWYVVLSTMAYTAWWYVIPHSGVPRGGIALHDTVLGTEARGNPN